MCLVRSFCFHRIKLSFLPYAALRTRLAHYFYFPFAGSGSCRKHIPRVDSARQACLLGCFFKCVTDWLNLTAFYLHLYFTGWVAWHRDRPGEKLFRLVLSYGRNESASEQQCFAVLLSTLSSAMKRWNSVLAISIAVPPSEEHGSECVGLGINLRAVDFLGLGASRRDRELELKSEEGRNSVDASGDDDQKTPRPGLPHDSTLTFSLGPTASAFEEKRVEELTDAEIMQLSGEECRRYMMKIKKERETLLPPSSTTAMTGLSTSKSRFGMENRSAEETLVSTRGGSSIKSGQLETLRLLARSGPELQQDIAGSPSTSMQGARHGLPASWHNVQSQASVAEEVHGGAGPSERAQPSGFGSPLPNYRGIPRTTEHSQRHVQANQTGQGSAQLGGMSRSTGQGHLPGRPPTAQLTIFYSGMVNVYDNVPADKAQAIMLLAGSGSSWSSSTMNRPPSVSVLPSTGGMASSSNSPARSGPAPAVAALSQAGPVTSPLVSTTSVAASLKHFAGRPTLHAAELPQARKASLARFLEKRKDRVRGKAPYVPPIFSVKRDVGSSTPPREKSPSPMNGSMCTRSPSPAKMNAGTTNRSSSPAQRPGPSQLSGNDTPSPKPFAVPQVGPQPDFSEDQASASATQRSGPEGPVDWRSQQRPHLASQDQKQEGSEER